MKNIVLFDSSIKNFDGTLTIRECIWLSVLVVSIVIIAFPEVFIGMFNL